MPPTAFPAPLATTLSEPVAEPVVVAAGTRIEFHPQPFKAWERVTITVTSPDGSKAQPGVLRADGRGEVVWRRSTLDDPIGAWQVDLVGDQGTLRVFRYTLEELKLPPGQQTGLVDGFLRYSTPEVEIFFKPAVHTATAIFIAQLHNHAVPLIGGDLESRLSARIDYYLMKGSTDFDAEVQAGGASNVTGFEAGISLYGFKRSGIYLDVSTPFESLPHLVIHELTHQVMTRIDPFNRAPTWAIEGFAEYEANKAALSLQPELERHWRRLRRERARQALEGGRWANLANYTKYSELLAEKDERVLDAVYAEAFLLVDYVAQTYGTKTLRPLFDQLSVENLDLDKVFQGLFGSNFTDFQSKLQTSVRLLDPDESKIAAARAYAARFDGLVQDTIKITGRWNTLASSSSRLTVAERKEALNALLASNHELESRAKALAVPPELVEPHQLLLDTYVAFRLAAQAFLRVEETRDRRDLDAGNAALREADFKFSAAQDRLTLQLQALGATLQPVS